MKLELIKCLFLTVYFIIETKSIKIFENVTTGETTNSTSQNNNVTHLAGNINSTGPVLYPDVDSGEVIKKDDTLNKKTKLFPVSAKSRENPIQKNSTTSTGSNTKSRQNLEDSIEEEYKDHRAQMSHKTLQRHITGQIPEIQSDFVASKPYSEKVFIPSPELKIGVSSIGEPQTFDTFQPIQPINVEYGVTKIEPKQELHHHYHHFIDTSSYHKLQHDVNKNLPLQGEYVPQSVVYSSVTHTESEQGSTGSDGNDSGSSGGVVTWPEYQDNNPEKDRPVHYVHHTNWKNTKEQSASHEQESSKENAGGSGYSFPDESKHENTSPRDHYHSAQNYESHHTPTTSEIPPAPVTEDVKDVKINNHHPYPFEIVQDENQQHNGKIVNYRGNSDFNHHEAHQHNGNTGNYHDNNDYEHHEVKHNGYFGNYRDNINFDHHEIKPTDVLIEEIHPQITTSIPVQIEKWKYKPVAHAGHGKLTPKKEPWKDVLHILSTIIPIGLLITALTPNVIVVNPNATVPSNRNPFNNYNLYSKQRSGDGEMKEFFNKKLNDVVTQLHQTASSQSKCIERAFCELSKKSNNNDDPQTTEKLHQLLQMIVNRSQGLKDIDDSLSELFETAKNNDCSIYECDKETSSI